MADDTLDIYKKVFTRIQYNYLPPGQYSTEYFNVAEVGKVVEGTKSVVIEIIEHVPQVDGDRLYYDVLLEDFTGYSIFKPYVVEYNLIENDDETEETEEED